MTGPADLLIDPRDEVTIRQRLTRVARGDLAADRRIRVGRLLDVHSRMWLDDQEIIVAGRRIAYVGPFGSWPGTAAAEVDR